jgi:hypothetical protein
VKLEILEGIDMKPSDINGENYQRTALFDAYICSMHFFTHLLFNEFSYVLLYRALRPLCERSPWPL